MDRLFLMRHARAAWGGPAMRDFDRPLTESGRSDAGALGRMMREHGWRPALVLCSPAMRTRQTWDCVEPELGEGEAIRLVISDPLYDSGPASSLACIQAAPDAGSILVIGHNPVMEDLAAAVVKHGEEAALRSMMAGFPAGALAVIAFSGLPAELAPGKGRLEAFLRPDRR